MTDLSIRGATHDDVPFMREMLYWAATVAYALRDLPLPTVDATLADPVNARYINGWGRDGDAGVIAELGGQPAGSAWDRLFAPEERGHGIVAPAGVPEIAIGVAPEHRGCGAGQALLEALLMTARDAAFERVRLSVDPENPARRLYARCGFVELPAGDPAAGTSVLMEAVLD